MIGIVICSISLLLSNLGVEYFRPTPDYIHAFLISWEQFVAIAIYHWLWVSPELNRLKFESDLEKIRGQR